MYEKHYGLSIKPFQTIPNPDIFYLSPKHENALTYLEYGIMEKSGFVLLTGEIGSGKTTLIRYLLNKIECDMETAVIFNTNVTAEQLVEMILSEFEVEVKEQGKASRLDALFRYLIEMFGRERRVLLIIDEAQNLDREALEEVRMLSNLQTDDQGLLQIMLVGQPELGSKLMSPELVQLNQRITVAYHIPALSREEAGEYIGYRLEKAGGRPDLFTKEAVDLIFKSSGGIPRTINIICDTGLVYGFSDELHEIDAGVIRQVIEDREGMGLVPKAEKATTRKKTVKDNDDLLSRILSLETGLTRLRIETDMRLDVLEKTAVSDRDEIVQQLRESYRIERERNNELLSNYLRLKEDYLALAARIDTMGGTPLEGRDSVKVERAPVPQAPVSPETFISMRDKLKKEVEDTIKDLMEQVETEPPTPSGTPLEQKKTIISWFKSR